MKCLICGKEFDNRFSLERHITTSFGKEKESKHLPILVYRCNLEGDLRFSKDGLKGLYLNGMSTPRISKHLGVNKKTLLDTMKYYGIKFRNPSEQGKNRAKVLGVWNDGLTKYDHPSIMRYAKSRMGKNNPYYTAPNFEERRKHLIDVCTPHLIKSSPSRNPKSTELRMIKILKNAKIPFKRNFCLKRLDAKWRLFDFIINGKLLMELQGNYWHANPSFHEPDDIISVRSSSKNGTMAKDIWAYDAEKKQLAIDNGYLYVAFWESDMNSLSDEEIIKSVRTAVDAIL
jgi:hypothetical protein